MVVMSSLDGTYKSAGHVNPVVLGPEHMPLMKARSVLCHLSNNAHVLCCRDIVITSLMVAKGKPARECIIPQAETDIGVADISWLPSHFWGNKGVWSMSFMRKWVMLLLLGIIKVKHCQEGFKTSNTSNLVTRLLLNVCKSPNSLETVNSWGSI